MGYILIVVIMLVLLLLKGFFSGSEIALVNSDKIKLRHQAKQGHRGAELSLKLLRDPAVLLSTTLVGTNISTVGLTTLGTLLMIDLFGSFGEVYAFLFLAPFLLILGEIVPKSIYQQKSDTVTPVIIYPLRWMSFLFYPVVFIFSRLARAAARIVGVGKADQPFFITREQLHTLFDMAEQGSAMSTFGRGRIRRVIRFAETTVAEAMVPIADVTTINQNENVSVAIDLIRKHGYNRLPVYESSTNNITGVATLTTWDLLDQSLASKPLDKLTMPALYVTSKQTIDQLLPILRQRPDHMAIVVDEYGSAIGMITMEDIVEEVVGEIDVGYDFEEYQPKRRRVYERLAEGVYLMDSLLSISETNEVLSISLPPNEFHTIGGMLLARLRHIPKVDEFVVESGYRFTVAEATERSIIKLRVEPEYTADQSTGSN